MITPRATRLLRVADLRQFRDILTSLVAAGDPLEARDQLVIVPSRAAAAHLRRTLEDRLLPARGAMVLPELVTRDELAERLADRLRARPRLLTGFEREVLLAAASRQAADAGAPPPFRLRPGLVAEMLDFYDALRRHGSDIDAFERLTLGTLEPNADFDRGADRLVRQTRFLVEAFREFERRSMATGALDEHALRAQLIAEPSDQPWRHVIVAVRDVAATPRGLWACDFELLTRLSGLERVDVVVTEAALAGGLHERLDRELPGIEEVRLQPAGDWKPETGSRGPILSTPRDGRVHLARDREEEVRRFARRVRHIGRQSKAIALDRIGLVVRRPLPYVYLARDVLASARIPCQMFDALPLAAEPYSAAIDLVFSFVTSSFSRMSTVALLRSPHFIFGGASVQASSRDIAAFDRHAAEAGYLGGEDALQALATRWDSGQGGSAGAARAGAAALALVAALRALTRPRPASAHLDTLIEFLTGVNAPPPVDEELRPRQLRAHAAIISALLALRDAFAAHDQAPQAFDDVARVVRRWIESQTFSPRTGDRGVHVVDADSAPFGDFDHVQLAGLVDGEWPQRPRRSIFYSSGLLKQLRWPQETARLEGERALFHDLLRLPARELTVSAFLLEDDAIVSRSPLADAIDEAALEESEDDAPLARIFTAEALTEGAIDAAGLDAPAVRWAGLREAAASGRRARQQGTTLPPGARSYSLSALERYQDCPFKFFATEVLRLEEPPEDQTTLSPRVRGRFVHEVFQRFFDAWDREGGGAITPERVDTARAQFLEVAETLLARLPEAEAALERARLFGSPVAMGIVDVVLGVEASRPDPVVERWLEYRLDGEFSLGDKGGRRAMLRGVADRVDLLANRRLRVIDYKTGSAPNVKRALQVPVYALSAAERLETRDGAPWTIDEASYVAFTGKRTLVPVIKPGKGEGAEAAAVFESARDRVFEALDGIEHGVFPAKPHDPIICNWCAFSAVCRKDYVGDE